MTNPRPQGAQGARNGLLAQRPISRPETSHLRSQRGRTQVEAGA